MSITTNYENLNSYILPEGKYEVVVEAVEQKQTKTSGADYMEAALRIRKDVEQSHGGAILWHNFYKSNKTDEYVLGFVMDAAKCLGVPANQSYEDIESLIYDFVGRCALVGVRHEEYNGRTYARVAYWNVSTLAPAETAPASAPVNDDLPF